MSEVHKIAPAGLFNLFDPTFLFLFPTFWSVLFVEADEQSKTLFFKLPTWAEFIGHATDPAVGIAVAMFVVFLWLVRGTGQTQLTRRESLAANWHLWNSILIYTCMDGLNGAFSEYGFLPLMHEKAYQMVDRRYRRHLIGTAEGPSRYEANLVRTLNATELFVYSWMSFLCAVGICRRAQWYKTLEVVVLTMAAYGAFIFLIPDYLDGCLNMHPMGVPDCTPPFTPFYIFFVWFGVLINWIWFLVPVVWIVTLVKREVECTDKKDKRQ